jgi:syntaxin 16
MGEGRDYLRSGMLFAIVITSQLIARVDISDEVEEILGRVSNKSKLIPPVTGRADSLVAALDKLHAKHVLPGFTDRTAEEREIERQTQDITRVSPTVTAIVPQLRMQDFRKCTTLITAIRPAPRSTRVETTTAKNVQRGLAQKVQDTSGLFRKKQRVYMQSKLSRLEQFASR